MWSIELDYQTPAGHPWNFGWLIHAPGAHPFWSQYLLLLYDLLTPTEASPKIYLPGATHEFLLFSVNPDEHYSQETTIKDSIGVLDPPNHGYQFRAEDNLEAQARLSMVVNMIITGELNPDSDARAAWDALFHDGVTLRRNHTHRAGVSIQ